MALATCCSPKGTRYSLNLWPGLLYSGPSRKEYGFSLIETAFVLVIGGIILAFASASWHSTMEARRFSAARTHLLAASDCLKKYVLQGSRIPPASYFSGYCSRNDPWGRSIIYFNAADDEQVAPGMASLSFNYPGGNKNNVAWVLVSRGANGSAECTHAAGLVTCNGDDVFHYVTVEKLYEEISRN